MYEITPQQVQPADQAESLKVPRQKNRRVVLPVLLHREERFPPQKPGVLQHALLSRDGVPQKIRLKKLPVTLQPVVIHRWKQPQKEIPAVRKNGITHGVLRQHQHRSLPIRQRKHRHVHTQPESHHLRHRIDGALPQRVLLSDAPVRG